MSPVFLRKLIFAFLNTFKQLVLGSKCDSSKWWRTRQGPQEQQPQSNMMGAPASAPLSIHRPLVQLWCHYLAHSTDFSSVPAAVCPTISHKGGIAAQHYVQDDTQTPQITTFIVERSFFCKDFHHLGGHVLCGTTLKHTHKVMLGCRSRKCTHY